MRRLLAGVVVATCVVVLAACGSDGPSKAGGSSTAAARIPAPLDVCPATKTPWRALPGVPVDAAAVGTGPAVIFANDSGNSVCAWLPLAAKLVASGHRVAMFSYADPSVASDPANLKALLAVATATAKGSKYALIGASLGGRLVIEAAAAAPAGLVGIVSLSGEATIAQEHDITPAARRVKLPVLYVGSRQDQLTDGIKQQNALHAALRGADPNLLLQRPGASHGTTLLVGVDGAVVVPRITTFVDGLLR